MEIELICTMTNRSSHPRNKVEVLTANYPISVDLKGSKKRLVSEDEEADL